jgi:hypothetical protein
MLANQRKILLHVGLNKTGSTSIQRFYFENREDLLERGFLYPDTGLVGVGHHSLAWSIGIGRSLRNNKTIDRKTIYHTLKEEFKKSTANNLIISSEYFCIANDEQIAEIAQEFSSLGNVTIFFVLRRQDKWIESLYSEVVQALISKIDIALYYEGLPSQFLDFYSMTIKWKRHFPGRITIIPYQEKRLDIHHVVSTELGIDFSGFKEVATENVSLSPQALAIMRMLPQFDEFNQEEHDSIISFFRAVPFIKRTRDLLSPELRNSIKEKYSPSNAKLEQRYLSGKVFFSDYPIDINGWERPDIFTDNDWITLISHCRKNERFQALIKCLVKEVII